MREKLIYSERNHVSTCLFGVEGSDWQQRSRRNLYDVMEMFYSLTRLVAIQAFMCVRIHQTALQYLNFIITSYTIMKLVWKRKKHGDLQSLTGLLIRESSSLTAIKFGNYEKDPAEYWLTSGGNFRLQ